MIINPKIIKTGPSEEQLNQWAAVNTQLEQNIGTYATIPSTLSKLQLMVSGQPFSLSKYDLQGITGIGNYAFYQSEITAIDIPESVTSIGRYALEQCFNLTSITIPDSVTSIGQYAFAFCSKLTQINFPINENFTTISNYLLQHSDALTSIIIPSSVNNIGTRAFYQCTSLSSITVLAEVPPTIGSSIFYNIPSDAVIYVPDASVEAYKTATNWVDYADKIQPLSSQGGTN